MNNPIYEYFRDGDQGPRLHPCYVVFADLLGTKQRIKEVTDADEITLLKEIVDALHGAEHCIRDNDGLTSIVRYYSDCVSLITPAGREFDDSNYEASLGFTIPSLIFWQAEMVRQGVFVRGGVAFGGVYVDDLSIFGKAHLDAYELETTRAIYPRIILDTNTVELAKRQLANYSEEWTTPHEVEFLVDIDEEVFLNYLHVFSEEEHEEKNPELAESLLANHQSLVQQKIATSPCDKILKKYEWVAGYHNWFCSQDWSQTFDTRKYLIPGPTSEFRNFREWVTTK